MGRIPVTTAAIETTPSTPKASFRFDAEWRRFGNWLLIWVVMANIGFAALWFVGAPPRFVALLDGLEAELHRRFPHAFEFVRPGFDTGEAPGANADIAKAVLQASSNSEVRSSNFVLLPENQTAGIRIGTRPWIPTTAIRTSQLSATDCIHVPIKDRN